MADTVTASDAWQWDETLFAGTARFYKAGRLPYAPGLESAMRDALGLDGTGRLLDCGCGPGTIALRLSPLFREVVGLDPDPGMLEEAAAEAARQGVRNASWVRMRAEELPAGLGTFQAVTFAASFHWMDRLLVARTVREMLQPGGAAVQVDAPGYRPEDRDSLEGLPHPLPPDDAILELRKRYLGPDRRAGQGIRNDSPYDENSVFVAAGYEPARTVIVPDGRIIVRTTEEMVANAFSTSSTAPHLFGESLPTFEADLRALLAEHSPAGLFAVRLPDNRLSIWHPA